MAKALILYDSVHGNTETVAEKIAEGIGSRSNIETTLVYMDDFDQNMVKEHDTILIGSPNHMSRATRKAKELIKRLGDVDLKGKTFAFFDTCLKRQEGRATGKMEKWIREAVPDVQVVAPGLSILVDGVKGPITEGEIVKCQEFGERMAEV